MSVPKTFKLNNGYEMPVIGLGTYLSKNAEIMENLIRGALDAGYRHIDTAVFYENHEMIGKALTKIFSENKYKREDIFITTKLFPFAHLNAVEVLEKALKDLNTPYIDLYLVHWPVVALGQNPDYKKQKPHHITWSELEETVNRKLARSIGVSNYNVQSLVNILSLANIKPVVNQFEHHVYLQQPELVKFCQKNEIVVTAYSPFCRGGLEAGDVLGEKVDLFGDKDLLAIAQKYKKTVGQVVMNFYVTKGVVAIPKTEKVERLAENINFFDFQLSTEEVAVITGLDKKHRILQTKNAPFWDNVDIWA